MFVLIILLNIFYALGFIVLPLKNYEWKVENVGDSSIEDVEASVTIPSGIYSALREAGILQEDILYGFNDVKYRWVSKQSWKYYVNFSERLLILGDPQWDDLPAIVRQAIDSEYTYYEVLSSSTYFTKIIVVDYDIFDQNYQELVFHGLDGTAIIYFNRQKIGVTTNTFVRYRFDVTELIQINNILEIVFEQPIKSALISSKLPTAQDIRGSYRSRWNGEKYINFLRRMQASFGSDFGPAFPSVGVWKEVELVAGLPNEFIVRDIVISTVPKDENWHVKMKICYEVTLKDERSIVGDLEAVFTLENDKSIKTSIKIFRTYTTNTYKDTAINLAVSIPKADVKPWWPNGYGEQNLYNLIVRLNNGISSHEKSVRVGFRTVKLVQEYVDSTKPEDGLSFYFVVNDIPIFAKGANFLPTNILPEKASNKETIKHLLRSAKIANMNMLRVTATGIYQSDYFYELCDEYGILIWQDMMFYMYLYPNNDDFLSSVTTEIEQQIMRLQYHPSIVLWVGNSEIKYAIHHRWHGNNHVERYLFKYDVLEYTIKKAIMEIDDSRPYVASTPNNGPRSHDEDTRNELLYGDTHSFFKTAKVDAWLTDHYIVTRFASEYGLQSLPSFDTLRNVAENNDILSLNTSFMKHRQHALNNNPNRKIEQSISYHFGKPKKSTDLRDIIYASQVIIQNKIDQAWFVKLQTEWNRTWRSALAENGTGKTMGSLYWHLNDVWPAPTWSSIEYGGKWKILHYYARKFFSPVLVSADLNGKGEITIHLTSDLLHDKEADLKIQIFTWHSLEPVADRKSVVLLKSASSKVFMQTTVHNFFNEPECISSKGFTEKCFLKLTLLEEDNEVISDNYLFPISFKNIIGLQNPTIITSVTSCGDSNECTINMKTNAIALFVWLWLDTEDIAGYFSDNGFIMTEPEKEIVFHSEEPVNAVQFEISLHVKVMDENRLKNFSPVKNKPTCLIGFCARN